MVLPPDESEGPLAGQVDIGRRTGWQANEGVFVAFCASMRSSRFMALVKAETLAQRKIEIEEFGTGKEVSTHVTRLTRRRHEKTWRAVPQ